jgi:hypothetical protein
MADQQLSGPTPPGAVDQCHRETRNRSW